MEQIKINILCILTLFSCFLGFNTITLHPLVPQSCPYRDEATHTCYEMSQSLHTTCLRLTLNSCNLNDVGEYNSSCDESTIHNRFRSVIKVGTCVLVHCNKKCCMGWRRDDQGRCLINDGLNDTACENDCPRVGDKCICKPGLTGDYCEQPICDEGCVLNGGVCAFNGWNNGICICPPARTGNLCEHVICEENCENGGTCVHDGIKATCLCPDGFYGKTCSMETNVSAQCLASNTIGGCTQLVCIPECTVSSNCTKGKMCCSNGCCMKCMDNKPTGCMVDGVRHRPGEEFVNGCTVCICQDNGEIGLCYEMKCPELHCRHGTNTTAGHCCSSCNDYAPSSQTPPSFSNSCFNGSIKEMVTDRFSNAVDLKLSGVTAIDYSGRRLQVFFNPAVVPHCACSIRQRHFVVVIASATDQFHETAFCAFVVHVIDQTSPQFVTCPTNIHALEDEEIIWEQPIAYDAVGIQSLYSTHRSGSKFTVGSHMVTYTATDFDDNKALCIFMVNIQSKDTDSTTWPAPLKSRIASTSTTGIIVGSVCSCIFALAMIIMATKIYKYRKSKIDSSRHTSEARNERPLPPSISNSISKSHQDLESGNHVKMFVLPSYTPVCDPPPYEEIAHN